MAEIKGTVFNIQRFSTEDGPGVRTTVFLKGCPLRCLWCANPESQSASPQLAHRESLCIRCGVCVKSCPERAIFAGEDGKMSLEHSRCTGCGVCVYKCPVGARKLFGRVSTVSGVFEEIKKDAGYYLKSKGGVTVSGGEPLMQADFVAALFTRCRALGIHTALDTCGYYEPSVLYKVLSLADLVLFDIKHMDRQRHRQLTGVYNDVILQNAQLIAQKGVPMLIRVPLIPGVNDSAENMNDTAFFVSGLGGHIGVELLPYHELGIAKYEMLGMDYRLAGTKRPTDEKLNACREIFLRYGIECSIH